MADAQRVTREQVKAMAEAVQLDLPEDRLDALVKNFSHFLDGFDRVRAIEVGDREPPTLVPGEELAR